MQVTYRPLGVDWPGGTRTSWSQRRYSTFKAGWSSTLRLLDRELGQLDAKAVVFQIDVGEADIRLDGLPKASARPTDPAVIISFESKHGPLRYYCDKFMTWQENVRAVALGLEALRRVERYGITRKGEQYAGWKALPPGTGTLENVILAFASPDDAGRFILAKAGIDNGESDRALQILLVDKAYRDDLFRRASKKVHPDVGGNRSDWDTLVEARRLVETNSG